MADIHTNCRQSLLTKLARIGYLVNQMRDMKHDNCPYTAPIDFESLQAIDDVVTKLRRAMASRLDGCSSKEKN
jgi:hypothetical protein